MPPTPSCGHGDRQGEKRDPKIFDLEFGRETTSVRVARWKLLFSEFISVGHG
jgi:hypothetical protein